MADLSTISDEDLAEIAVQLEEGEKPTYQGEVVTPDQLTPEQKEKIERVRKMYRSQNEGKSNSEDADKVEPNSNTTGFSPDTLEDGRKVLPGGVIHPEGYDYVGDFNTNDEFGYFPILDTLERVRIEDFPQTMSVSYDQDVRYNEDTGVRVPTNSGSVRVRMIHDGFATIYVFRKDEVETDTTYIKATLGHG